MPGRKRKQTQKHNVPQAAPVRKKASSSAASARVQALRTAASKKSKGAKRGRSKSQESSSSSTSSIASTSSTSSAVSTKKRASNKDKPTAAEAFADVHIDDDLYDERMHDEASTDAQLLSLIAMTQRQISRVEQEILLEDHEEEIAKLEALNATTQNNETETEDSTSSSSSSSSSTSTSTTSSDSSSSSSSVQLSPEKKKNLKNDKIDATKSEYDNWECPALSVPICGNVTTMGTLSDEHTGATFDKIRNEMLNTTGQLFDIIHMDPPWQLATGKKLHFFNVNNDYFPNI